MVTPVQMLPDFMIIGAMKAGTSSLFRYLESHPEIVPSSVKETDFFFSGTNYERGQKYYESLFQGEGKHALEASPNYTKRHIRPGMPEKIHALMPALKMVFVARDPIDRLVSHYVHNLDHGRERRSFSEAVLEPDSNYLQTSRYFFQLEAFLDYFPREQLLVIESEKLRDDTIDTVAEVCEFFQIPADCDPEIMREKIHQSTAKTEASQLETTLLKLASRPKTIDFIKRHTERFRKPIPRPKPSTDDLAQLRQALAPDVEQLRKLTGLEFPSWKL